MNSILVKHFFRRFFDNDTLHADGDTQTSVVRALSTVATPGLMLAFWMQNQYPQRTVWGGMEDRYFYVLFSFVVMGLVAVFEWEMLFPDRLDFLILSPLSLRSRQMLGTKAAALAGFFGFFLVASNLAGTFMLPAITYHIVAVNGHVIIQREFWRQVLAHGTAVMLAGLFSALLFLAIGGVLLCVLSVSQFRLISPILQMLSVMVLVLLLLQYALYGDSIHTMLSGPLGRIRYEPPIWFLGVYEWIFHGTAAPAFAREMTRYALRGTAIAALTVLMIYPISWARMRRMAIEGGRLRRRPPALWLAKLIHRVVRLPAERAVFHFIRPTIVRNNRYQVYLAMYCGVGLGLAVGCAATYRTSGGMHLELSESGLHAVMPLLLFWVVAGLRSAFAFPLNLPARWVFRVTGVNVNECARAAHRWVLACALTVAACIVGVLRIAGWDVRRLLVQAVCGVCLAIFLTDGFFLFQWSAPFTQPRMPGKTSLPLVLTLYLGILPLFVEGMARLEMRMERNLITLCIVAAVVALIHRIVVAVDKGTNETEEEMEGYEGEFQLLGLAQH